MAQNNKTSFFVTETNPEIFKVVPRAGGIVHIDRPKLKSNLAEACNKEPNKKPSAANTRARSRSKIKEKPAKVNVNITGAEKKSLLFMNRAGTETAKDSTAAAYPREYKLQQILAATPWSVEFDEYYEPTEESKRIPDPFQDSVDMLAMTISVIMLMSRGRKDMSDTHLKWVYSYLDCVRDEFGKMPPNVQGILNHINMITDGKIKSFLDEDEDVEEAKAPNEGGNVGAAAAPAADT